MCVYLQKSIVTPEGTIQHTRKKNQTLPSTEQKPSSPER